MGSRDVEKSPSRPLTRCAGGELWVRTLNVRFPRSIALLALLLGVLALASSAHAAGELDPTFGGDGRVVTDGVLGTANGVAIQADSKIVAAGTSGRNFALARYNPDGGLDTSFSGDGRVVTDFGASDGASAVAIQADGRIVAAGFSGEGNVNDFALARYNPNGGLDSAFDGDGRVVTDFGAEDEAFGIAIQADGRIVAAGTSGGDFDFALARYLPTGGLDPSFDGDGRVLTDFPGPSADYAFDVAIQVDGKIVAAGTRNFADFALARYNPNGGLDPSFGGDGRVETNFGGVDVAHGVAIQADGKIVAAGLAQEVTESFALARYNPDGSLDPSFGGNGLVLTSFGSSGQARDVAIQADGKIVAVGFSSDGSFDFALARYNPDGSLDPSFGGDGRVVTDFGRDDFALGVALQADGKIVAAGTSSDGTVLTSRSRATSATRAGRQPSTTSSPTAWTTERPPFEVAPSRSGTSSGHRGPRWRSRSPS